MNGSVVPLIDKPRHDKIINKAKDLNEVFYNGDKLSGFEVDVERMYISEKMEKYNTYVKRKSLRYKVRWTMSDLNRYQD